MSLSKSLILPALLASLCTSAAVSQERREVPDYRITATAEQTDRVAELDRFFAAYSDAWARQDTAALMALHSGDTEWINAYARMFQDRDTLGRFLEERLFPQFPAATSRMEVENMTAVSTRLVTDDVAVLHLYTDGDRGMSRNDGETLRRTHFHFVLHRTANGWRIVHTAIMDARN